MQSVINSTCASSIQSIKTFQDNSRLIQLCARCSPSVAWLEPVPSRLHFPLIVRCRIKICQIEKEALGVMYAHKYFRDFTIGFHTTVETDYWTLLTTAQKNLCDMLPRLQHFFLRLMPFDTSTQYVPGKDLLLANALSWIADDAKGDREHETDNVTIFAASVLNNRVSPMMADQLVKEAKEDDYLRQVTEALENGNNVKGPLVPFKVELTCINGILLRGSKVVISKLLRNAMLQRLHEGHMNIEKCKGMARLLMYWPGYGCTNSREGS